MRHVSTVSVLLPLLLSGQTRPKRIAPVDPAQRQVFEHQSRVAILAGVGHYPSRSGLTGLRYPAHDVDLLDAELVSQGYKVVKLQDGEATRASVEQALTDAAELVDKGQGLVLFFFSGHGFADQGVNYLATFEATATNLAASGLPIKRVEELLKATGAPRQVMFVDACRNEPGKSVGARSFDGFRSAEGMSELFSTKMGRISFESDQLGSGVFTHFLVKGLHGEAAGRDGLVTFRDLADFVTDGVSSFGFQAGQMQVPFEAGEHRGDFLLARLSETPARVPAPVPAPSLPSSLPSRPAPPDPDTALSRGMSAFDARDYASALPLFRIAADAGNADALRWMGWMFHNGFGVAVDYEQALNWYRKSAAAGDGKAMRNIAGIYEMRKDYAQAMTWNLKSAATGEPGAMNQIGYYYRAGLGVPQNYPQAVIWFRKAAQAGNAAGMNNLGFCYHNAKGVTRDLAQAMKWYRLAAEAGDSGGMNNVGFLYLYGLGVPKNQSEAVSWFRKAAAAGSTDAADTLRGMGVH